MGDFKAAARPDPGREGRRGQAARQVRAGDGRLVEEERPRLGRAARLVRPEVRRRPAGRRWTCPATGRSEGLPDFDGIAWFRKEFDLPEAWDGKELTLGLGPIDDRDTTFFNGVEVGHMDDLGRQAELQGPRRGGQGRPERDRRPGARHRAATAASPASRGDMKLALAGDDEGRADLAGRATGRTRTPTPMGRALDAPGAVRAATRTG